MISDLPFRKLAIFRVSEDLWIQNFCNMIKNSRFNGAFIHFETTTSDIYLERFKNAIKHLKDSWTLEKPCPVFTIYE